VAGNAGGASPSLAGAAPRPPATVHENKIRAVVEWSYATRRTIGPAELTRRGGTSEMYRARKLEQNRAADLLRRDKEARHAPRNTLLRGFRKEEKRSSWRLRTIFHNACGTMARSVQTKVK